MSDQQPWIQRVFEFDFPVERHQELIARLESTPARLQELTGALPARALITRHEDDWSIQENVGHLLDLETLFIGRLDDYDAGAEELRPADMSNRATEAAGHNDREIHELLAEFADKRGKLVKRLKKLSADAFSRSAYHRRLDVQMRLVDMCHFQAEHDDHHITKIARLVQSATATP
jgi:hypothetical protein